MAGEGLPQDLGKLLPDGGAGRALDVDLPPGRLVVAARAEPGTAPGYWLSDEPASPDLWVQLRGAQARSGLWPVLAAAELGDEERPWVIGEVWPQPRPVDRIGRFDAATVLAGFWRGQTNGELMFPEPAGDDPREMTGASAAEPGEDFGISEPFGRTWPGLAPAVDGGPDPDEFADQYVLENDDVLDDETRIMLVPAARSADVITAAGWSGPCNYTNDIPLLSSVLRSWEDRFGARVIRVGFATLLLSVAAPPVTTRHAELVAAEHFAFCPDQLWESGGDDPTIRDYAARMVRGHDHWWFWWD